MTKPKKILGVGAVVPLLCLALTGCVPEMLSMEISSPSDGAELAESPVIITGTVSDSEATVTVNGTEVEVAADGSFSAEIELSEAENTIEAVAMLGRHESKASITITYTPAQ